MLLLALVTTPGLFAQRVTTGLQALYLFEESSGSVVNDASGVGSPLNLNISHPGNVTWLAGGGLRANSSVLVSSPGVADKIRTSIQASNAYTLEVFVDPLNSSQNGPARILSLSNNIDFRNFTLGQQNADYISRTRSNGNTNGTPDFCATGQVGAGIQHVVFTRGTDDVERIYVDGVQVASWTRSGDFTGWSSTHKFALFNELTQDRPWLGSMYLAAVYSRALTPTEINQNRTTFLGGDCASGGDHQAPTFSGVPANLSVSCGAIPPAPSVCRDVETNYATTVHTQVGIVDASHSLGAPDGQGAQFYESGDKIEWTFGSVLPAGTQVCVTWSRRNYTATTPDPINSKAYIWEISGSSYYQTQVLVTASTDYITQCFQLSYACDRVKIKNHGDASDFKVDAIGYQEINCLAGQIVVSDNCDLLPSVVFNETIGVCSGGSYAVNRTWTATDAAGNSASASQVITVLDNEAPVLSGAPANLTADCGAIPAADVLTALDGCGGQVCPVQGYNNGTYRRSLWLPLTGLNANYVWVGGTGNFEVYDNGTAHLTGTVQNKDNALCGWEVDVWFSGAYDWATWSAMGRTYKPGPGTTGTIYETWTYYEVDGSRSKLTGTGCFAGDVLNLTNKPSDFSMGLQIGAGANDMDATYGMSFWFYYTGTIYGATASGNGDFNLEGGCTGDENAGLNYEYWTSASTISSLASFLATAGTPVKTGITPNAQNADHLAIRTVLERYVIRWTGAIEIPTTGNYTFFTKSDDGSRLYIDGVLVVNNDGLHAASEVSGTRHLTAGCHSIEIQFFENTGSELMETRWQGPGIAKQLIPNSAFKTSCSVTSGISVPVSFNEMVGTCASGSYQIVRTWTATDACGNSSSHTQTITVTDTQAPVLSMQPANISLNCNDPIPPIPSITAADNCDLDVTVHFSEVTVAGVLERTWTATDDCGNSTSYTQQIALNPDLTKPVLSGVPSDISADCGSIPAAALVTAMDDCDGAVMVILNETYGPGPDECRTINRTWTATDAAGNSISATQIITVLDNLAPNLVGVPNNLNLNCGEPTPAPPLVIAVDNCDASVSVMFNESVSGNVITRTWTASDACGNTVSASQGIILNTELVIANVTVTAATSCSVNNGVVVIDLDDASAGSGPYTVTINGSFVLGPFASEPIVISNAPGGATINSIVVEDAGGCEGSSNQTYLIGEPELEILTVAVNDADCASGLGSVVIDLDDAKAGMPPYRVKIGSVIYGPFASEPMMVHLAPGSYTAIAVRDNKGCFDQKPGTIAIDPASGCSTCLPPTGTGEVVNGRHTVDLFWNLVIDATGYLVSIRKVGTTDFLEIPVAALGKRIGGLEPCTSYEWCVRALCSGVLSDCSPLRTFTTSCGGAPRVGEVDLLESDVFPNPTASTINLSITLGKVAELSLEIYDVTGMLIHAEQAGRTNSYQARFDLSGRAPGVYLAKWQVNGESVLEKFVYTAE